MKTGTNVIVNSGPRRFAFVMVCALIASVGLAAKVALNGLDRSQDRIIHDFMQPSQQHSQGVKVREKANLVAVKSAPTLKENVANPPATPAQKLE